jgi:hypothetical protein
MTSKDKQGPQQYVEMVVQHTQQFMEETLRENERLRALTVHLEGERARSAEHVVELKELIAKMQLQQVRQQHQMSQAETDNQRFSAEFSEIEQQNSNLANLFVASYRLCSSLDRREVLQVVQEVIINLIGSEELAIFELDQRAQRLRLLASFGIDEHGYSELPLNDSPIARSVVSGEMFVHEPSPDHESWPPSTLTAVIPLKVEGRVIGAIAIFRLLPQKQALAAVDRELFALLGSHAAMALYCSGLHAQARGGR